MGLKAVFLRNAQGVYGGDAAGCGGDIGGVVEGTARQVLLRDEGVGKVPRVWVHVAGPRGDARRGEQPGGVVLAGRCSSNGRPIWVPVTSRATRSGSPRTR